MTPCGDEEENDDEGGGEPVDELDDTDEDKFGSFGDLALFMLINNFSGSLVSASMFVGSFEDASLLSKVNFFFCFVLFELDFKRKVLNLKKKG